MAPTATSNHQLLIHHLPLMEPACHVERSLLHWYQRGTIMAHPCQYQCPPLLLLVYRSPLSVSISLYSGVLPAAIGTASHLVHCSLPSLTASHYHRNHLTLLVSICRHHCTPPAAFGNDLPLSRYDIRCCPYPAGLMGT